MKSHLECLFIKLFDFDVSLFAKLLKNAFKVANEKYEKFIIDI